jgi:hypothetical protein
MNGKEGVMAAIMAAIDQFEEEEVIAMAAMPLPPPRLAFSPWKYWGLNEMMRMRILWQLRKGSQAPFKMR